MKRQLPILYILLLNVFSMNLAAQEAKAGEGNSDRQEEINNRWIESQAVIIVFSDNDPNVAGQPFHASIDTLYLYPSFGLPVGENLSKDLQKVAINKIDSVRLQKGGNLMTRSRSSRIYQIPNNNNIYDNPQFQAVKNNAVYQDSLVFPEGLEDAFPHSRLLRQAFPKKHLRISFGVGFGGNSVMGDAEEALAISPLLNPDSYQDGVSVDFLDISYRFLDRFIVGGQYAARRLSTHLYGYYSSLNYDANFNYEVYFSEQRLYAEYAFFHVDRFLLHRYELLVGAGFLMGKPEWSMYYSYIYNTDPDTWFFDEVSHRQEDDLYGFQIMSSFHYYLFNGFSLWAGVEANLYKPWTIEAVELPTAYTNSPIVLQEHTLGFSGVRIRFGVSIYL